MIFGESSHRVLTVKGEVQPDREPKLPVLSRQSTHKGSSSQEAGGVGISGSQPGVQTLKSLVEVTLPEESSTYR